MSNSIKNHLRLLGASEIFEMPLQLPLSEPVFDNITRHACNSVNIISIVNLIPKSTT